MYSVIVKHRSVIKLSYTYLYICARSYTENNENHRHTLTLKNMNQAVRELQFAVRGPIVMRAQEMEEEIKNNPSEITEIIKANIGDGQAMDQKPLTFTRQLVATVMNPCLFEDPNIPLDVKCRAREILEACKGNTTGSATEALGLDVVRKHVADYIELRDGIPSCWEDIFLTSGVTEAFRNALEIVSRAEVKEQKQGILFPVPGYPLYKAALREFGLHEIKYFLNEERNWAVEMNELKCRIEEARCHCHPIAIIVTNPGNPTGQVFGRRMIENIIKFANEEKLFIIADEVYQKNVYNEKYPFFSFKKVIAEMDKPYNKTEVVSFHSCSKGILGEAGFRGGYMEFHNFDHEALNIIKDCLRKINVCPPIYGQVVLDSIVNPPNEDEESYELFAEESTDIFESLKERAEMVTKRFNEIPGYSVQEIRGAMYAFPKISLPEHILAKAFFDKVNPDSYYCYKLLETTGICVVPGAGFGQKEDTYHFRTTILPQKEKLQNMLDLIAEFHEKFIQEDE